MKRYLWSYRSSKLSPVELSNFKSCIQKLKITDIFLSMAKDTPFYPHKLDSSKLSEFIKIVYPIRVHAMVLEDTHYLNVEKYRVKVLNTINSLSRYNSLYPQSKLSGVHLDVEPHSTELWKNRDNYSDREINKQLDSYLHLISYVGELIDSSFECSKDILYSAATGWWYETTQYSQISISELGRYLDAIAPMGYNSTEDPVVGNVERILRKFPFELWSSRAPKGSGFIVGLALYEYSSISHFIDVVEQLENHLIKRYPESFKGVAIFSDKYLSF
jgi:hypothetical protein